MNSMGLNMEWPIWWNSIGTDLRCSPLSELTQEYISTGLTELDSSLQGGLAPGAIYEIFGEAGTGKTNLCLEILKNLSKSSNTYYISTQKPLSSSRLSSISLNTSNLIIRHSTSLEQFTLYIYQDLYSLLSTSNLKLLVIDNIYSLVQDIPYSESKVRVIIYTRLAIILKYLSFTYNFAVIITNNVVSDMNGNVNAGLGINWSNCINHRWIIEKKNIERSLKILQSNIRYDHIELFMEIDNTSVKLDRRK